MTRPENTFAHTNFEALVKIDAQVAHLADGAYSKPVSAERVAQAKAGLESKGFKVTVAENKDDAFEKLRGLIPAGVSLNVAHSTTLEEIGFINYLMGETPYNNIRGTILAEKDPAKQAELRRTLGTTPDYFLTSVSAITLAGSLSHGDQTGTKVGPVSYGAGKVIVVAGINKIVENDAEALKRTTEWCVPLASAYGREVFGAPSAALTHYEVIHNANPFNPDRIEVLLINEALGF
ncbi:hypothetical protein BGZ74_011252 [Mortierella antarctica]|nr:hypothetical protein BGZ74_011252 [Mortierella antarctica]